MFSGASETSTTQKKVESSKKGLCWSELKHNRMSHWGTSQLVNFQHSNDINQIPPSIVKEEEQSDGGDDVIAQSCARPGHQKRKCRSLYQLGETIDAKPSNLKEENSSSRKRQQKKLDSTTRWSAER